MKKSILILALISGGTFSFAQCKKTVTYFSGKAEFLDNSGKVERSDEGKIVVKVSPTQIILMHNDDDNDTMEGSTKDSVCQWETPFKNGKTIFTTTLVERSGERNEALVSIIGKDGKLVILINFKERGKTIRLIPDSYKYD